MQSLGERRRPVPGSWGDGWRCRALGGLAGERKHVEQTRAPHPL